LTSTRVDDFLEEIQELLEEFTNIVVDELPHSLPLMRSVSHHIDLIRGASLLNKAAYRLTSHRRMKRLKGRYRNC
jgi:hypothetical protein